jgi:hypothetical protein
MDLVISLKNNNTEYTFGRLRVDYSFERKERLTVEFSRVTHTGIGNIIKLD